ncbi:MAG: SirB2 family protein [Bacteroidetes bacterium]|nr:SirB2 family protein [Bacteroidota bacterium]
METGIRHTHLLTVILFLTIYLIKTVLLLLNKQDGLAKFTKTVKVPEMIISTLFLVTGIYMLTQVPEIKSLMIIKIAAVLISIPLAVIGFKKQNKILAVASLLLIITAYGLAEMSKKQKSKSMENVSETTLNGQELYNASCVSCHGADGKLNLMGAKDLSVSAMDLNARIEIITNGKNAMSPFGTMLTPGQIKAVAEYTETLKK